MSSSGAPSSAYANRLMHSLSVPGSYITVPELVIQLDDPMDESAPGPNVGLVNMLNHEPYPFQPPGPSSFSPAILSSHSSVPSSFYLMGNNLESDLIPIDIANRITAIASEIDRYWSIATTTKWAHYSTTRLRIKYENARRLFQELCKMAREYPLSNEVYRVLVRARQVSVQLETYVIFYDFDRPVPYFLQHADNAESTDFRFCPRSHDSCYNKSRFLQQYRP